MIEPATARNLLTERYLCANIHNKKYWCNSMVTIYDIAKATNLSPSTVARALNNKGYCSAKARKKVEEAARNLGYVPLEAAKTLKNSITNKIMLCLPDIMNPYYFGMINGVTQTLDRHGYNILLGYTQHNPQKELEVLNSLKGRFVDGLIFGSFDYTPALVEAIRDTGLPTVITSLYKYEEDSNFYDCVYTSQPDAAFMATNHCVACGHKQIAFIGGNPAEQNTNERLMGYKAALDHAGIPIDERRIIFDADFTSEGAYEKFSAFLEKDFPCSAVVACNDLMGVGCMRACVHANLRIPEDISIISLDNTDYCLCTNPAMTSVDMMQEEVGKSAAEFVIERIMEKRAFRKEMSFAPSLVIRDSVKII